MYSEFDCKDLEVHLSAHPNDQDNTFVLTIDSVNIHSAYMQNTERITTTALSTTSPIHSAGKK